MNPDCEFIIMLYAVNVFQPFKLSFVTVVNQINAIARFSDWFVMQWHLVDVLKNCLYFFLVCVFAFLLTSIMSSLNVPHDGFFLPHSPRFHFLKLGTPIWPFLLHVTSHPIIYSSNSTRRSRTLIKPQEETDKNNISRIISNEVSNWTTVFCFLDVFYYLSKHENYQDGNKQSESNIPLAHDLICVQPKKNRLCCIFDNNE